MLTRSNWFDREIVDGGRLPLFCLLCAFILGFAIIRFSVRMIRAQVRWWPGNVESGGLHIHHVIFGLVFMLISGVGVFAADEPSTPVKSVLAAVFGLGSALVLDEFALVLHLRDVYWTEQGRTSVDAVFIALAVVGLILLGFRPIGLVDWEDFRDDPSWGTALLVAGFLLVEICLATVTLLKGKLWTGLAGVFVLPLLVVGVARLSRPDAPWARWRYRDKPKKLERARRREARWREPAMRAKVKVQEFLTGRHDEPG
jgi:hypothetical protein